MIVILTKNNLQKAFPKPETPIGVVPKAQPPPPSELVADGPRDRLLKLIPGEAAAAYTVACGMSLDATYLPLTAFVLSSIVLVLTIYVSGKVSVPPIRPEPLQYVVRMTAFVAWAFAIRNPIGHWMALPTWIPALAVLFIPLIGTFLIGLR